MSLMSKSVSVVGVAALAAALIACAEDEPATHASICVEKSSEIRVEDDKCPEDEGSNTHFVWWYYPIHVSAPAVGSSAKGTNYITTAPAGAVTSTVPAKGGFGGTTGTTGS